MHGQLHYYFNLIYILDTYFIHTSLMMTHNDKYYKFIVFITLPVSQSK